MTGIGKLGEDNLGNKGAIIGSRTPPSGFRGVQPNINALPKPRNFLDEMSDTTHTLPMLPATSSLPPTGNLAMPHDLLQQPNNYHDLQQQNMYNPPNYAAYNDELINKSNRATEDAINQSREQFGAVSLPINNLGGFGGFGGFGGLGGFGFLPFLI